MATTTTNLGLTKPAYADAADIAIINSNMDIIDSNIKSLQDTTATHTSQISSLQSSVDSNATNIGNLQTAMNSIKPGIIVKTVTQEEKGATAGGFANVTFAVPSVSGYTAVLATPVSNGYYWSAPNYMVASLLTGTLAGVRVRYNFSATASTTVACGFLLVRNDLFDASKSNLPGA